MGLLHFLSLREMTQVRVETLDLLMMCWFAVSSTPTPLPLGEGGAKRTA